MIKNTASASYRQSGVDIDVANAAKREFAGLLERTGVTLNRPNAYAAVIDAGLHRFKQPVLVFKSEEPGSKQILAFQQDRVESVCFDMINHLINDCIVSGAIPVSVQDVVVCGKLDGSIIRRIVSAISRAAQAQGCFLSGGETSEQPGVLPADRYVMTSSIIGVVERDGIIDGLSICSSDVVIGIASSGLHTNGYSLVRRLLEDDPELSERRIGEQTFMDAIMEVHLCYERGMRPLFERSLIKGAAHITGGGIRENLNRILPSDLDAVVDLRAYRPHRVFDMIRAAGRLDEDEMLRTFNVGIGMTIVVAADAVETVLSSLKDTGYSAVPLGHIQAGHGEVKCEGKIDWNWDR
jgi:phosphoribosylformylglycinamidine cyclo-ligase